MKRDFHIGPGAASLILIVVILAMSVLSVLALTNARSDERLSNRSANVIESIGTLNAAAERHVSVLDSVLVNGIRETGDDSAYLTYISENLPEGMEMQERSVSWTESDEDGRNLCCTVEIAEYGSAERFKWKEHRIGSEFAELELEDTWN